MTAVTAHRPSADACITVAVQLYRGILLSDEKGTDFDTGNNVDEAPMHSAE